MQVFWSKGILDTIAPNYIEPNLNFGWFLQASVTFNENSTSLNIDYEIDV